MPQAKAGKVGSSKRKGKINIPKRKRKGCTSQRPLTGNDKESRAKKSRSSRGRPIPQNLAPIAPAPRENQPRNRFNRRARRNVNMNNSNLYQLALRALLSGDFYCVEVVKTFGIAFQTLLYVLADIECHGWLLTLTLYHSCNLLHPLVPSYDSQEELEATFDTLLPFRMRLISFFVRMNMAIFSAVFFAKFLDLLGNRFVRSYRVYRFYICNTVDWMNLHDNEKIALWKFLNESNYREWFVFKKLVDKAELFRAINYFDSHMDHLRSIIN